MNQPRTIDEITPEWMTEALRAGGVLKKGRVTRVEVKRIGVGIGFLGGTAQVRLTYDVPAEGAPTSVVVKLPAADKKGHDMGDALHAYEHEIRFYREIASAFSVRVPACYYTFMDGEAGIYVLMMEDLSGLHVGDQVAGMSRAQTVAAAETIAGLHAPWWQAKPAKLPWVPTTARQLADAGLSPECYRERWPDFVTAFGMHAPAEGLSVGERMGKNLDTLLSKVAAGPQTLVHYDYRADNMMFDEQSPKDPVVVIDWQLPTWGIGAYDVARVTGGSLPVAERGGHHEEIAGRWHARLLELGVTGYPWAQASRDYRLGMLLAMINPVFFHSFFKTGGPRGLALGEAMVERFFNAILECNAEAALYE